jgi:hypothetical protein
MLRILHVLQDLALILAKDLHYVLVDLLSVHAQLPQALSETLKVLIMPLEVLPKVWAPRGCRKQSPDFGERGLIIAIVTGHVHEATSPCAYAPIKPQ